MKNLTPPPSRGYDVVNYHERPAMNYRDKVLLERTDFKTIRMPFATYCALSDCQTLLMPQAPAKRFSATVFTHVSCPKGHPRATAAHKLSDSSVVALNG